MSGKFWFSQNHEKNLEIWGEICVQIIKISLFDFFWFFTARARDCVALICA